MKFNFFSSFVSVSCNVPISFRNSFSIDRKKRNRKRIRWILIGRFMTKSFRISLNRHVHFCIWQIRHCRFVSVTFRVLLVGLDEVETCSVFVFLVRTVNLQVQANKEAKVDVRLCLAFLFCRKLKTFYWIDWWSMSA